MIEKKHEYESRQAKIEQKRAFKHGKILMKSLVSCTKSDSVIRQFNVMASSNNRQKITARKMPISTRETSESSVLIGDRFALENTVSVKCLAQERNTMTRLGLEPRSLDPESIALTIRMDGLFYKINFKAKKLVG